MYLILGLLIIAVGAFCQSSSYVPINKIKSWSWESYSSRGSLPGWFSRSAAASCPSAAPAGVSVNSSP